VTRNELPETALSVPNLTFVVIAFNEEARLPNVLKNFHGYGRILVVDNFSADATVAIARARGCEVMLNKNDGWVEDYDTMERIKAQVQTEWIYWAMTDEIISKETLADMARVIKADTADVITILRRNYLYGRFCHDIAVSYQTKAFKKSAIDFQGNTIHNFGRTLAPKERIYQMPSDKFVHHLISNTAASYLDTINRYTNFEVAGKVAAGLNHSTVYYLLLPLKAIWRDYFCKGGRQAGRPGLILSALMLIYSLVKAMKGYEATCGLDATAIKSLYQALADELLSAFDSDQKPIN